MNGVEEAESCWVWDYQIQDFKVGGKESAWENYISFGDDERLCQAKTILEGIREDQELFRRYRPQSAGSTEDSTGDDANIKKRKRQDGEDEALKTAESDGNNPEAPRNASKSGESDSKASVLEHQLFGDWKPDATPKELAGTPWDIKILMKRYMAFGLYDAEYVYNAVDLYTGKLVYLSTNESYGRRNSTGESVWERFESMAKKLREDDFEWTDIGLDIEDDEEEEDEEEERSGSDSSPSPFTRVQSEAGETFAELQDRVGITAPKGGALYRVTKTENVSNTKLLVLYNTSTKQYQTEGVRETLKLNPTAKSVSVKPAMIPSGYELYVSSTSYNRKLAGGPVLLKTGGGDDESDNDDDMDE
eukprot:TRINITY_DN1156_c0_g1_i1.p1 TRINITY_DN1156_c0_g1~~TRINITY_DN1156_c0_g1_i1.p1  ORF type:complete len:361 (-),score=76.98 TRINITY_DN1156_c0_g1_i1:123-1205(-)